ncbi:MAG: PRC-barrel domain-containing protein [Neomegalonema sp.]|nr:PRC-barrel domain-containing protein [Neomegalonema sp.]
MRYSLLFAGLFALSSVATPLHVAAQSAGSFVKAASSKSIYSSDLVGSAVFLGKDPKSDVVGEVNNVVISGKGVVEAVIIGVGEFLGVEEKNVAVPLAKLEVVTVDEETRLVLATSKDELKAAPAFADRDGKPYTVAADEVIDEPPAEGLVAVDITKLESPDLVGARVYRTAGGWVGEVVNLTKTKGDKIDALIIDFSSALGEGEKFVAVGIEAIQFKKRAEDKDEQFYIFVDFSDEALKAAPDYDERTYESKKSEMRLSK